MKIDFRVKKTEIEWSKAFDKFWLDFTPKWFQWLNWIVILGGLTFLEHKTKDIYLGIITVVSYMSFAFYLNGFFYSMEFVNFPLLERSTKFKRIGSALISCMITIGMFKLFMHVVYLFKNQ